MWKDKQQHPEEAAGQKELILQRAINISTAAEMAVLDHQQEAMVSPQSEKQSVRYKNMCSTCGKHGHTTIKCHFRQMTCYKCGKQGHLQAVCKEQVREHHLTQTNTLLNN